MKVLGKQLTIQQGETLTLDIECQTEEGHPLLLSDRWTNPFLVITVSLGETPVGDAFNKTWWLDLQKKYVQQKNGTLVEEKMKQFYLTVPLEIAAFTEEAIKAAYSDIVFDNVGSDNYVGRYLFMVDELHDGNYVYKYVSDTALGELTWADYDGLHFLKGFDTSDWDANNYFYDIKIVCGTAVTRFVENQLRSEGVTIPPITTNTALLSAINDIKNEEAKAIAMSCYTENIPLIQPYQSKYVLVDHGQILVDTNLRGGSN